MPGPAFPAYEQRLAAETRMPSRVSRGTIGADVVLAYELYQPTGPFRDLLVFYHGAGVNMRCGYDRLAAALAAEASVAVCLTDVRGHGASGGRRGHTRRKTLVWDDVERMLEAMSSLHPSARIHVGGHSSAAGLLLNAHAHGNLKRAASLLLLAPNFGYHAALDRADSPFGGARFWPFVVNWFANGHLAGGMPAVTFDFSQFNMARVVGCVPSYTVNMALAVTPDDPGGQLARLDLPTWVGIADRDEIVDGAKTEAFLGRHAPAVRREWLAGSSHLAAILEGASAIAGALRGFGFLDDESAKSHGEGRGREREATELRPTNFFEAWG